MTDDYSADRWTKGSVKVGGSATGEIETAGDRDWFKVTFKAGRFYRIDLEGHDAGSGALAVPQFLGLYKPNGYFGTREMTIQPGGCYQAEADVGYYLEIGGGRSGTGGYRLSVTELTDDFAADAGTTGAVAVGGSATGEVEHGNDLDWFKVTLEAGRTYRIDLKGQDTGDGTLADPFLHGVLDEKGDRVGSTWDYDGGEGRNSRELFTAEKGGTYYVAAGSSKSATGTYTVSVAEELAAGVGTTGRVAVGGSATGEIDVGGDRDWFAVTLEAGKAYRIDLKGSATGDGTLADPYLAGIHDANGARIRGTWNDNGGTERNSRELFTADKGGTYYVAAGSSKSATGTYTVSVADVTGEVPAEVPAESQTTGMVANDRSADVRNADAVTDDYSANTRTTGAVAVGSSAWGDIETAGDRDWFEVALNAGRTYRIELKGERTGDGTLRNPELFGIHDAESALLAGTTDDNGGKGRNSRVTFTPEEDGAYYVAAGGSKDRTGTYTLSVAETIMDDFGRGTGTTGRVEVGGSAAGEMEYAADTDWFAVTLEAGRSYRIDLKGARTDDGTLGDPYLDGVYDAQGTYVGGADDNGGKGRNSRTIFTPDKDGTYYVAAGGVDDHTGTYTLSVEAWDDFAAGTGTTGRVAVGGSATGEIEAAHDSDWFAVTLEADKGYRIDLKGERTGDGTLRNPHLDRIYDAGGTSVGGADDNGGKGRNSRTIFTPEEDGTYYVAAGGVDDHTGTYTLSVEAWDDFAAGTGTTGRVEVGGSATGEIEAAHDSDWFAVTLEAGKSYRFDLKGQDTGDGTLADPYLAGVHDADGALIPNTWDYDSGEGRNSRTTFTPDKDGTYYVAAGAVDDRTGTYTLSVEAWNDPAANDLAADVGTTGRVAVGGSATGEMEQAADSDWFAVTLEAGKSYRFDLKGQDTGDGTLADPYVDGIHDANGARIRGTWNDNGGEGRNSRVLFTADKDGTYYVAISEIKGITGTYTLSVVEEFAAGTGTTGKVAVGGSATGEIDVNGDSDWFAVALKAGKSYRFDLKGQDTGDGTLADPYLAGVHDADGALFPYTWDYDSGTQRNSSELFTPDKDGTYYVAAGGSTGHTGTYTVSVEEVVDAM